MVVNRYINYPYEGFCLKPYDAKAWMLDTERKPGGFEDRREEG